MTDKEKKEWVLRYINKNNLTSILSDKYKEHKKKKHNICFEFFRFLRLYSKEIQTFCAIVSAIVIGMGSIVISLRYNNMVKMQTRIMEYEQVPIFDLKIVQHENEWDKIAILNNGAPAVDSIVRVIPYLEVFCSEDIREPVPVRVLFSKDNSRLESDATGEFDFINTKRPSDPQISSFLNELRDIPKEYTSNEWTFSYMQLIKIISKDRLNNSHNDYFLYDGYKVIRMNNDFGIEIESLYTANDDVIILGTHKADQAFKSILKILRSHNLYANDYKTKQRVLYGEYEPVD